MAALAALLTKYINVMLTIIRFLVHECGLLPKIWGFIHRMFAPQYSARGTLVLNDANSPVCKHIYRVILHDAKYLLFSGIGSVVQYLPQYIGILGMIEGACPVTRMARNHVEFETNEWVFGLQVELDFALNATFRYVNGCSQSVCHVKSV